MVQRVPLVLSVFVLTVLPLCAAESRRVPSVPQQTSSPRGGFHLGIGYAYRQFREVSFSNDSYSGKFDWTFLSTPFSSFQLSSVGPDSGEADRFYDDGAAFRSSGFGASALYYNASQVSGNTLTLHGQETTISDPLVTTQSFSRWKDDDSSSSTPYVQLDFTVPVGTKAEIGLALNLMFLSTEANREGTTFSKTRQIDQETVQITDTYTIDPNSFLNDPSFKFVGLASASPQRTREKTTESMVTTYYNSVQQSLKVRATTLSLGPTASYNFGRISSTLATGWAVNFVNWEGSYREVLLRRFSDSSGTVNSGPLGIFGSRNSGNKTVSGIFVQGALALEIHPRWTWSAFGRYDWDQKLRGPSGPGTFLVDLSGFSVGSAMNFQF